MKHIYSDQQKTPTQSLIACSSSLRVATLLCVLSIGLLTPKPSWASCKDPKPKNWTAGPIVVSSPTAGDPAIVVCTGQSVSVSVSASNKDSWEIDCNTGGSLVDKGTDSDPLTYQWTGAGTFTNATSASTSWTAPATAGSYNLTCTINDASGQVVLPETGSRKSTAASPSVAVCVVDPGTAPVAVSNVTYTESAGVATPNNFGLTTGDGPNIESGAAFDCTAKKWTGVVTKAEMKITIFWSLNGYGEASAAAATATNYCGILKSLSIRAVRNTQTPPDQWWVSAAGQAHERVHANDLKRVGGKYFPIAKATIEALTVDHTCGKTAAQAAAEIQAKTEYSTAISKMNRDLSADFNSQQVLDHMEPTGRCSLAERPIIDPIMQAIRAKATANGWAPCP